MRFSSFPVIVIPMLLSACFLKQRPLTTPSPDMQVAQYPQTGLSGQEIKFSFDQSGDRSTSLSLSVISGRLLPVADDKKQSVTAWRFVGEMLNEGSETIENVQSIIDIAESDGSNKHRNILPDAVQPGGFIPLKPGEREVYDIVVSDPSKAQLINIGMRVAPHSSDTSPVRLVTSDLQFVKKYVESGQASYRVSGKINNATNSTVKDLIVRFWAVTELMELPPGARTKDQVVAVGTWRAAQDVLGAGDEREFEVALEPLSAADQEDITMGSAELSALAMGTPIKL